MIQAVSWTLQGRRLLAGVAVAAFAVLLFAWFWLGSPGHPDFDQLYAGAAALRTGQNPYAVVGPGRAFGWPTPLYYPLPALLVVLPLTVLPIRVAGAVFVGLSAFALGWAIESKGNRWRYLLLLSSGFVTCAPAGQWSILLLAGVWLPLAGAVGVAKPQTALVIASSWSRRRSFVVAFGGAVALVSLSFVVRPHWLAEWLPMLEHTPWQQTPVLNPGGVLALAALLRWRRPEARLLTAYALIPQTPGPYTDLLLFAVPRTRLEFAWLATLSYTILPIAQRVWSPSAIPAERAAVFGRISTLLMLLPCLVMVLRRRNLDESRQTPV
jgi:hypothetical protein